MIGTQEQTMFSTSFVLFIGPLIQRDIRADKSGTLASKHAVTQTNMTPNRRKTPHNLGYHKP